MRSFYQDRLGTNIGNSQKETGLFPALVFSQVKDEEDEEEDEREPHVMLSYK